MITEKGQKNKNRSNVWVKVEPIEGAFVVNIGDMLERLTKGLYRSTPHRAKNTNSGNRQSFPFFYDPGWNQTIHDLKIELTP